MHPQAELKHSYVGPDVADLLLARAPHFLHIVKVLFDGGPVGEGFQNLHDAGVGIGAKQSDPTIVLLDEHNSDQASDRPIGGQERLDDLGGPLAVQCTLDPQPASLLPGPLGQTDLVLAVLAWAATTT